MKSFEKHLRRKQIEKDATDAALKAVNDIIGKMKSFKEYWNEHGDAYAMEVAENAWDYQQSKIDELTKQRDSFIKAYEIEMDESVELRKRVDAVKTLIEEYKDPPTEDKAFRYALSIVAYELEQVIRGGE